MAHTVRPFKYADGKVPNGYYCGTCGVSNVRLFRSYQRFPDKLYCQTCAGEKLPDEYGGICAIGWMVAAVPTEDGETYWGYTSIPNNGCEWWYGLQPLSLVRREWEHIE